jgi:hypothetical protein
MIKLILHPFCFPVASGLAKVKQAACQMNKIRNRQASRLSAKLYMTLGFFLPCLTEKQ